MSEQTNSRRPRVRFGIRTLILIIAVAAVLIVAGRSLYHRYTTIPLSQSVAAFNATASEHPVGRHEPPLTEEEIVKAIEAQLPTLDASDKVKSIYSRIAKSRRLPLDADLDPIPGYSPSSGERYTVWWINLNVMTGPNSGYGLRIRETDNPVAADDSKPLRR